MMGCSDTPQGMLTPRRVAFAAEEAFAEGLLGFAAPAKNVSDALDEAMAGSAQEIALRMLLTYP